MHNFPFFRRKLAHRLQTCAARRHAACAGDPTGEDLKIIAVFERLACDAERLPQCAVDEVARLCADEGLNRRFDHVWDALPDVVGHLLVPASAADLVRWMVDQSRHDATSGTPDPITSTGDPCCRDEPEQARSTRSALAAPTLGGVLSAFASSFHRGRPTQGLRSLANSIAPLARPGSMKSTWLGQTADQA